MLIYIHVPFCVKKCNYCAFHSEAIYGKDKDEILMSATVNIEKEESANNEENMPKVENTLSAVAAVDKWDLDREIWYQGITKEIQMRAKEYGKLPVKTIFFGGGTPSLIEPQLIKEIIKKIKKYFAVDPKAEITMEANPESLKTRHRIKDYLRAGINRLSIGIQSFDDSMLKTLGRAHNYVDAMNSVAYAREAGCNNINIDMMWGLPSQKVHQWLWQVNELMKLKPDHISMYGLTIEPDTKFDKALEKHEIILPEERDAHTMYMRGAEILQENGYLQYEISNFSRMGFQCRHNLGYWEGADYLGFGPSATSTMQNVRWTNAYDLRLWRQEVEQFAFKHDSEKLTTQDRVIELIMLRLRTSRGMRVKAFGDITGRDFLKDNKALIHALHKNGLIRIINGYVRLTREGFLVSNSILSHLFENTKKFLELGEDREYLLKLEEAKTKKENKVLRARA